MVGLPVLANSEDSDQTPRSVASDLGLHYLPFLGFRTTMGKSESISLYMAFCRLY